MEELSPLPIPPTPGLGNAPETIVDPKKRRRTRPKAKKERKPVVGKIEIGTDPDESHQIDVIV